MAVELGSYVGLVYVCLVVALVWRIEALKSKGVLPATFRSWFSTEFNSKPSQLAREWMPWTLSLAPQGTLRRILWLVSFVLGSQHEDAHDSGVTWLVYGCRCLLFVNLVLFIASVPAILR